MSRWHAAPQSVALPGDVFAGAAIGRARLRRAAETPPARELVTRLELATSSLARRCSTTELHPRKVGSNNGARVRQRNIFCFGVAWPSSYRKTGVCHKGLYHRHFAVSRGILLRMP